MHQLKFLPSSNRTYSDGTCFLQQKLNASKNLDFSAWVGIMLGVLCCVKSVCIQSFSGPYFPAFGMNMEIYGVYLHIWLEYGKNTDQNNYEYGHLSRSAADVCIGHGTDFLITFEKLNFHDSP